MPSGFFLMLLQGFLWRNGFLQVFAFSCFTLSPETASVLHEQSKGSWTETACINALLQRLHHLALQKQEFFFFQFLVSLDLISGLYFHCYKHSVWHRNMLELIDGTDAVYYFLICWNKCWQMMNIHKKRFFFSLWSCCFSL